MIHHAINLTSYAVGGASTVTAAGLWVASTLPSPTIDPTTAAQAGFTAICGLVLAVVTLVVNGVLAERKKRSDDAIALAKIRIDSDQVIALKQIDADARWNEQELRQVKLVADAKLENAQVVAEALKTAQVREQAKDKLAARRLKQAKKSAEVRATVLADQLRVALAARPVSPLPTAPPEPPR
jgi:hypothetical protein